jgi:hypothetical protein
MGSFRVAEVVRKALFWCGVDGQFNIMIGGLCDFAQEAQTTVVAGATPWPLVCR